MRTEARAEEPSRVRRAWAPLAGPGPRSRGRSFTAPLHQPLSSLPGNAPSNTSFFSFFFCLKKSIRHLCRPLCQIRNLCFGNDNFRGVFIFHNCFPVVLSSPGETAFENASLSAELREAGRGFFKGGRKGGVWERVRSQHEAPQAARNLSHHRTLRGLRVIFPHFVGITPSLPRTQLNSFMGTETSWFP